MDDFWIRIRNCEPRRLAMLLLAALVLFRLLYLVPFLSQFGLAGDESYYWEWGRRLDWGYLSKPPMIGWLMGLAGRLSGDSTWGVRLAALLLGSGSLLLLHRLTERLFGARAALFALLLAALTPANAALNLFFTIDAPLVFLWTAALLAFWRLVEQPHQRAPWVWLTVILGLGHLSKQMMLVFPLLMILFAWSTPAARPLLRRRAFWSCIAVSLLFLIPPLWWNAQHDWVTFSHTRHHFENKAGMSLADHLGASATFLGLQAALFSPLTWLLMIGAAFGGLWKWRALTAQQRFAVTFSAPALAAFLLLSLRQEVNPNWPAVFYLTAVALAAAWLPDRWTKPALIVGAVTFALSYALPFAISAAGLSGHPRYDRAAELRAWHAVGAQADRFFETAPRPDRTFAVMLDYHGRAAQLAFHTPRHPQVFRYTPREGVRTQYDIWPDPGDAGFIGGDALIFKTTDETAMPPTLVRAFESIRKVGEIQAPLGRDAERFYHVYLGENLKFWPEPRARLAPESEKSPASSGDPP